MSTNNSYDYVICGGGTSGSVVAARLSMDLNATVLLIEAGADSKDMENVHMVGGWTKNFDTEADWNIVTEPSPGANNRQVKASRGKFLGGSSGCNGTLCIRGTKQDYDDWNLDGWSGEEMWKNMSKSETFHDKDWFESDSKNHGSTGPLHTAPMDLAPISNLILESMESKGLKLQHDMFTTGDNPHGCGHATRTAYKGLRTTAADFLKNETPNLSILTNTLVDKVILTKDGSEMRATAVQVIGHDGKSRTINAKKEIIISGGAYCSPAILMRSGIGAREKLEPHGIECQVELPGVGENLLDHLVVFMFYEVSKPGLTTDHLLYHDNSIAESYRKWKEDQSGPLGNFPFGAFAFARLDERLADDPVWKNAPREPGRDPMGLTPQQPNIEFFTTECYGGPKQYTDFPIDHKHCFAVICELFSPRSKGDVKLSSADPKDNPVVHHNYLSDPLDLAVISEACAFGNEIITEGSGTKSIIKGSWPSALTHHTHTHRDDWKSYVKENATTCYHPGGTAKMGSANDPMAVLDERLRVRGVKGLRVADVSVMPTLNQGHTQMPAYGIGEKAAELVMEDAREVAINVVTVTEQINSLNTIGKVNTSHVEYAPGNETVVLI